MEVWNQLSQAPWPVFGAQIIIKTGGEASKKLGWLRFFWKTWIESCPILRKKKKKQLVNAARSSCAVQPLHWAQSSVWFVWVSPKMGVPLFHQNPPNHRFAKNCSSPCLALIDPLKAWIHLADSPQRPRGFQIPSGKARCAPTWTPAAAGRAAAAGC